MNKKRILLLAALALLVSCGGGKNRPAATVQPTAVDRYTYRIVATYPHPTDAYTQGLQYAEGLLWEGTGEHGHSLVQTLDLDGGAPEVKVRLPKSEFGEGITLLDDKLYQLTWQSNTAHVYTLADGRLTPLHDFRYPGEGWGLTSDGEKLYMTDGSANIYTLDPATFRREKRTTVTFKGEPVLYLNELEWIDGKIWANVYTTDSILIIDPATGIVEGVIDLEGLLPEQERTPQTDVLNGIAYDAATGRIFVTGKNWSKLFEIEILRK